MASYKCDDLFVLTEDVMRTCRRDKMWSGTEPKCGESSATVHIVGMSSAAGPICVCVRRTY